MARRADAMTPPAAGEHVLCGWTVQPALNRALRDTTEVRLEPRIMQVLACLLCAGGEPVTREKLMAHVWGHEFVTEDALNRCISKLRRVLVEELGCDAVIDTIPKVGYRLRAPGAGDAPAAETPRAAPATGGARLPPYAWFAGLGAAALGGALVALYLTRAAPAPDAADDGRVRPLTTLQGNEEYASLSPDGSLVAYAWRPGVNDDFDVVVQPVNSESLVRITDDPAHDVAPAWSPDGTTLAFLRIDKAARSCAVLAAPPVGGPARRITDCHWDEWTLTWTPDGRGLVFVPPDQRGLARFDLATGAFTQLTEPPHEAFGDGAPSFSPDGRWLAFVRWHAIGVADVYVAPATGGEPRRLTFDNLKVHGVTWDPDGRHLVYSSNRAGTFALWRVSLDGDAPRRVPFAGRSADNPVISRDGRRLIYEEWHGQTNIFALDLRDPARAPRQVTLATRWDWTPAVSPDGARLAFASDRSGSSEIWVSASDGATPLRLTAFDGPYTSGPVWSPDGARLAFDSPAVDGNFDLYLVDAAGGAPLRLTTHPAEDRFPTFAADGRHVYFGSRRSGHWEIWRIDLASRAEEQVTRSGAYFPQLAEDGRALYFTREYESGIYRLDLARALAGEAVEPERMIEAPAPVDCTNWVYRDGALWFIERSDGRPWLAAWDVARRAPRSRIPMPEPMYKSGIALAADGTVYYSQVVRNETDLVIMEYGR